MKFILWKICLLYLIILSTDVFCTEATNKNKKLTTLLSNSASHMLGEIPSELVNSPNINIYTINDKPSSEFFTEEINNKNKNNKKESLDSETNKAEKNKEKKESLNNLEENLGKKFRDFRISLDLSEKQNEEENNPIGISYPIDKFLLPDNKQDNKDKIAGETIQSAKEKNKNSSKILEIMENDVKKINSTDTNLNANAFEDNKTKNKNNNKNNYNKNGLNNQQKSELVYKTKKSVFESLNEDGNDNAGSIKAFEPSGKLSDLNIKNNNNQQHVNTRKINKKNKYTHFSYPRSKGFQGFLSLLNRNEPEGEDNFDVLDINRPKYSYGVPSIYDFKIKNQRRKNENNSKQMPFNNEKTNILIKQSSSSNQTVSKLDNSFGYFANKTNLITSSKNKNSNIYASNKKEAKEKISVFDDIKNNNSTNINNNNIKVNKKSIIDNSAILSKESKQIIDIVSNESIITINKLKEELENLKKANKELNKIHIEKGSKILNLQEEVKKEEKEKSKLKQKLLLQENKLKTQELEIQSLKMKAEKHTEISSLPILKNENFRNLLKHLIEVNINNLNTQNYQCMMACADVRLVEKQFFDFAKIINAHVSKRIFNSANEKEINKNKTNGFNGDVKNKMLNKKEKNQKGNVVSIGFIQKGDWNARGKNITATVINNYNSSVINFNAINETKNFDKKEKNIYDNINNNNKNKNKLRKFEAVNNRISLEINKLKDIIEKNGLADKSDNNNKQSNSKENSEKINELQKIVKKLESDKQQGIEIMKKVSNHNKFLMQENTIYKKQITDITLINKQLEKDSLNIKSYTNKIKEIAKKLNSDYSQNKNSLQEKQVENYELNEKLKKCVTENYNYRHIVDSNLVLGFKRNSDLDFSFPDDSFSRSKFTGFSFKSIGNKIDFKDGKSDNDDAHSKLIGEISSILKNETKLERERNNLNLVSANETNANLVNNYNLKANNTQNEIKSSNNDFAFPNDMQINKNYTSAIVIELNKTNYNDDNNNDNNNNNKKLNVLYAKKVKNNEFNNIKDEAAFKIKKLNIAKKLNKDLAEETEKNFDFKFLYKEELNGNAKKTAFERTVNDDENSNNYNDDMNDMKHLLTHIPINFLEMNSQINPISEENLFNLPNLFLEQSEKTSTLNKKAIDDGSEEDIKKNLSEYKKLMAKQKELNAYLQKTENAQRFQRENEESVSDEDSKSKSAEELKSENYIQDANLKREFILNKIKKLKDQKYLESIEETKSRIAKKLNKMKANDELGSEAASLLNKFTPKNSQNAKIKNAKTNKNLRIINKYKNEKSDDLFGLENKPVGNKRKMKVNVNKGKLNLSQLSKFAKRILLDDKLSAAKDLGKKDNKDLNQNVCWEMMYDLLWKNAQGDDFEIDENEIYQME